jgi:HicB family
MSRFNGQIHVRVPAEVHKEVAMEAFERGTSISGIFAQALIVRRTLKTLDPWKAIEDVQVANRDRSEKSINSSVKKAVKAVRKDRR